MSEPFGTTNLERERWSVAARALTAAGSPGLILASASPRRRELLAATGLAFEVMVAQVTEEENPLVEPRTMVAHNAALKADWVAERRPEAWVLGADTTVYIEGHALNKPRDGAEARAMLRRLSGRTHTVFTGLALRHGAARVRLDDGATTEVTFKTLDDAAIEAYLARVSTFDKAGGYGIQSHGEMLVAGFKGEISNIIGLPLTATKQILTRGGLLR